MTSRRWRTWFLLVALAAGCGIEASGSLDSSLEDTDGVGPSGGPGLGQQPEPFPQQPAGGSKGDAGAAPSGGSLSSGGQPPGQGGAGGQADPEQGGAGGQEPAGQGGEASAGAGGAADAGEGGSSGAAGKAGAGSAGAGGAGGTGGAGKGAGGAGKGGKGGAGAGGAGKGGSGSAGQGVAGQGGGGAGPEPPPVKTLCEEAFEVEEPDHIHLDCPQGLVITGVIFASYGLPSGECGSWKQEKCHAKESKAKVEALCLGKPSCEVKASNQLFGDPCEGEDKSLAVEVHCSLAGP